MSKITDRIDAKLAEWIRAQALFFVGTAPLGPDGHVNVSPKGPIGTLRVVDEKTIAYLDLTGSGAETIAHLRENGRIVVMLCAFEGAPRIVRLHGKGEVVTLDDPRYGELLARCAFDDGGLVEARRTVIVVHLKRVADSCGYTVPLMRIEGTRTQMRAWVDKKMQKGPSALADYKRDKNALSIDGLPALDPPKA